MHKETKNNTQEITRPPLPPTAVFDEQQMAEARPVQPLPSQPSRKFITGLQDIFGRRFTAIATMIAGVIICVGLGAASVDWNSDALASQTDTAQAESESLTPSIAPPMANRSTMKRPDQKQRSTSIPQARERLPPFEFNAGEDTRRPRARMVSVIH